MSKCHVCVVEDANKFGVQKAHIIQHFRYCLSDNKANGVNIIDGKVWIYSSAESLSKLFTYFKRSSITRWLKELEDVGFFESANYNKKGYDRTKWYTIPSEFTITQNEQWNNTINQNEQGFSNNQLLASNTITQNEQCSLENEQPIQYISKYTNNNIINEREENNVFNIENAPSKKNKCTSTRKSKLKPFPEDFHLTDKLRAYAIKNGIEDPDLLYEQLKNYCASTGKQYKCYPSTYQSWVLREKNKNSSRRTNYDKKPNSTDNKDWYYNKACDELQRIYESGGADIP